MQHVEQYVKLPMPEVWLQESVVQQQLDHFVGMSVPEADRIDPQESIMQHNVGMPVPGADRVVPQESFAQ